MMGFKVNRVVLYMKRNDFTAVAVFLPSLYLRVLVIEWKNQRCFRGPERVKLIFVKLDANTHEEFYDLP